MPPSADSRAQSSVYDSATKSNASPEPFGAGTPGERSALMALSPLDGRYARQTEALSHYFAEFGLMRYRFAVEIEWLIFALTKLQLPNAPSLEDAQIALFRTWTDAFAESDARQIKAIERTTRHDVKAVEYVVRERLSKSGHEHLAPYVHLCCTSEDINNISHALMLRDGLQSVWLPALDEVLAQLVRLAKESLHDPMLARTHGQAASPTTLGKELAVFVQRLRRQRSLLTNQAYLTKFSGAVGNYNAHAAAYPDVNWPKAARDFIDVFGLAQNPITTQIEPHDYMAEVFHALARTNAILIDLDRDMWTYISLGYLKQKVYAGEVGSSTMPHKVNPIDFENSEANAGLSTAILDHLALKLPISRMQRDLSDSSAIRTVGTGIGHSLLALKGCLAGLKKVDVDRTALRADLDRNWAVLGEAIQTILRKHGVEDAYERIKAATQAQDLDGAALRQIVEQANIPEPDRTRLMEMSPSSYIGLAVDVAMPILDDSDHPEGAT